MNEVHVIVPASIDDPARPSGGNVYDRRICEGLAAIGWSVHEHPLPGAWPRPDAAARAALNGLLAGLPDGAAVLLDGLIASAAADLPMFAGRLLCWFSCTCLWRRDPTTPRNPRRRRGRARAAAAVVTTSAWTKDWLLERYALVPDRIHVVEPGADAAELAPGTDAGGELLCVAAVTPGKGQDVLVAALTEIKDLSWQCVCVGAMDLDPGFVDQLRRETVRGGIADRIRFVGTVTGTDLDAMYAAADVVVLASRAETYGMVVTEALARGIPVIATAVGGVPEALGYGGDRIRPGILVPPDDPRALAAALRDWLGDPDLRSGFAGQPGSAAESFRAGRLPPVVCPMSSPGWEHDMSINRTVWRWMLLLGGIAILAALVWRVGAGPFVDGITMVDGHAMLAASLITLFTTVCCAWRWRLVARGLGIDLPLSAAVAAYYRSQFVNSVLPGGVLGDVHRGVDQGLNSGDVGRGLRSVAWERVGGHIVQVVLAVVVLVLLPSPVHASMPLVAAVVAVVAVLAVVVFRVPPAAGPRSGRARSEDRRPRFVTGCSPGTRGPVSSLPLRGLCRLRRGLPHRRTRRRSDGIAAADAAARCARAAGHVRADEHRGMGSAGRSSGVGFQRLRARCEPGRYRRRGLRCAGICRLPPRCGDSGPRVASSPPRRSALRGLGAPAAAVRRRRRECHAWLSVRTPC